MAASRLPPSMDPPSAWRGKNLDVYANIRRDGSVEDVHLVRPSGDDALDAAMLAQVKQSWHWAPLDCGRTSANQQASIRIPRQNCVPAGWTPAPSLTLAQSDRNVSASLDIDVAPDGRMLGSKVVAGSGDAALDAALLAHVRQSWHFWPLADGCPNATKHIQFRLPEMSCVPQPVTESRTPPAIASDRPRALDVQIGVGPDGKLLFTNIVRGSGDAALDAAAVAHVKAAWRWQPITCKRMDVYQRGEPLPVMDFAHIEIPASGAPPRS
jgi:TonB family protein